MLLPRAENTIRIKDKLKSLPEVHVIKLVHSWNTGGEPELISVLRTTASTVMYEK